MKKKCKIYFCSCKVLRNSVFWQVSITKSTYYISYSLITDEITDIFPYRVQNLFIKGVRVHQKTEPSWLCKPFYVLHFTQTNCSSNRRYKNVTIITGHRINVHWLGITSGPEKVSRPSTCSNTHFRHRYFFLYSNVYKYAYFMQNGILKYCMEMLAQNMIAQKITNSKHTLTFKIMYAIQSKRVFSSMYISTQSC